VVTVYKRADGNINRVVNDEEIGKLNKLGYNRRLWRKDLRMNRRKVYGVRRSLVLGHWAILKRRLSVASRVIIYTRNVISRASRFLKYVTVLQKCLCPTP